MKTIWKFALPQPNSPDGLVKVPMPKGAEVLKVATQFDSPYIWALVDTEAPDENREFTVMGTGWENMDPDIKKYLGTFKLQEGHLIFHVFEI